MPVLKNSQAIAVIIPAYNAENFIEDALQSVACQERLPNEVIVVDDGSKDGTVDKVTRFSKNCPFPLHLIRQTNKGVSAARNTAYSATIATFIAQLDADDLMLPQHLATLERIFHVAPGIVVGFGDQKIVGPEGTLSPSFLEGKNIMGLPSDELLHGIMAIRESPFSALLRGAQVPASASLFNRHAALEVGLYDEALMSSEDRDFQLRISRVGRFAYTREIIAEKREHSENLTHERHAYRLSINAYLCLRKISNIADQLKLSDRERRCVREELSLAAKMAAYAGSLAGVKKWLPTAIMLMRDGYSATVANPICWLRAILAVARSSPGNSST
jgi:glycosyltransferase involved in cell wall biosynthesis